MQKTLLIKAAITTALALTLLIPLTLIHSTVDERQASVVREVAGSFAGAQTLAGPVLVFPYTLEWTERVLEDAPASPAGATKRVRNEYRRQSAGRWVVLPGSADWNGHTAVDFKHRGLFKVLVYDLSATVAGRFEVPAAPALPGLHAGLVRRRAR